MYETVMTVVGTVVSAIDSHRLPDGTAVATFRVVSTPRRQDRATGAWVDGDKLYIDVKCWRGLAENTVVSLGKGDPVVVTGRLYTRTYEQEGLRRSAVMLDAHSVAADLTWCTAVVSRTRRAPAASAESVVPAGGRDRVGSGVEAPTEAQGGDGGRAGDGELVGAAPAREG